MSESTDNYLKTIYALSKAGEGFVTTNALSEKLGTRASSVTDMLKKLNKQGSVSHEKYHGVSLTTKGEKQAVEIVRRHRIWEVFLSDKLGFRWDEVHELAEQLEHISSHELITRLEAFLGHPKFDPHGDPIPDKTGKMPRLAKTFKLSEGSEGEDFKVISVDDSSSELLQHLDLLKIRPGVVINIRKLYSFDQSLEIIVSGKKHTVSATVAASIHVQKNN
ncbi:MAG: metal-dependent transcriptional regulator [Flavobacteriales bacterium]|nr:metal-dependent transcriptional regulator [Flavobacteriales bacterium]